jgi:hypothetical protein
MICTCNVCQYGDGHAGAGGMVVQGTGVYPVNKQNEILKKIQDLEKQISILSEGFKLQNNYIDAVSDMAKLIISKGQK